MKTLFKNKFLIGAAIIFWLSLYFVVSLQTKVEIKSQEAFKNEISMNVK